MRSLLPLYGIHTSHRACGRPPERSFSAKRGRRRRRRRMGCGKQGAWAASSRKRSCKPSGVVAAGHTPSGASCYLPQQAGEGICAAI